MSSALANIGVGVLGATGYIGVPYRAEMRVCEGVRVVAVCARRRELLEQAAREDGADLARRTGAGVVVVAVLRREAKGRRLAA